MISGGDEDAESVSRIEVDREDRGGIVNIGRLEGRLPGWLEVPVELAGSAVGPTRAAGSGVRGVHDGQLQAAWALSGQTKGRRREEKKNERMNRMQKNSDRWGRAYLDMLLDRFQKLPYSRGFRPPRGCRGSIHGLKVPDY